MLDLIRKGNDIDFQNLLGGGVLINGKSPLDKESLIDLLYPKGMTYVFPSKFDPVTQLGGGWTQVADNVNLPIGDTADTLVEPNGSMIFESLNKSGQHQYLVVGSSVNNGYGSLGYYGTGEASNNLKYYSGLKVTADLSTASNTQTVSIWKRTD